LATTVGFVLVFGVAGGAISLGAFWLGKTLPWIGFLIGIVLVLAGVALVAGWHIPVRVPMARPGPVADGLGGDLLFGVGYGAASLTCTLPIFVSITATAMTGGLMESALSFVAYGVGMGTVLTALAVMAALSRRGLALAIGRSLPYINRVGGAFLLLAGAYVTYYWGYLIFSSEMPEEGNVIIMGERLSSTIRNWLGSSIGEIAIAGTVIVLLFLSIWATWRHISPKAGRRNEEGEAELLEKQT
jgi:cytochrome c biogenesis protein CcdA